MRKEADRTVGIHPT